MYTRQSQNTVAQFIYTRPIMDLCLEAERRLGDRVVKQWWDQDGLRLSGVRGVGET